jgi:site-specific recombinase XerD
LFKCGRPRGYLFPQQRGADRPIDTWFISRKIHEHEEKLGWERRISSHTFRHAFGTHLYENGADLLLIKELMGHRSLASTVIYIHLAAVSTRNAMSPLDRLGGKYSA